MCSGRILGFVSWDSLQVDKDNTHIDSSLKKEFMKLKETDKIYMERNLVTISVRKHEKHNIFVLFCSFLFCSCWAFSV